MQTTSQTYDTLFWANARRQIQVKIEGVTDWYTESSIISASTSSALFAVETMGLGGCVAKKLNLSFYPGANRTNIPRMASIQVQLRLTNGTTNSAWIEKGIYYVDTRKYDPLSGIMEIEAFDAMLKGEVNFIPSTSTASWPRSMSTVLTECATRIGVSLDSRNATLGSYNVQLPMELSIREVLGYIASANGGNFVITDDNKLRLVKWKDSTASTVALGTNCSKFITGEQFQAISRVTINCGSSSGSQVIYTAGDDTGMNLEIDNPWGTQTMANALVAELASATFLYLPYEADNATLNPAAELGDFVTINGTTTMLCSRDINFDALCCMQIGAPANDEIDHEYPCMSQLERMQQTIESKVSGPDIASTINQTPQSVQILANKIDLQGYVTMTNLSTAGQTTINGGNITTGTISADRIDTTDLYVQSVWFNTQAASNPYKKILYGDWRQVGLRQVLETRVGYEDSSKNSSTSIRGGEYVDIWDGADRSYNISFEMASYSSLAMIPSPSNTWELGSGSNHIRNIYTRSLRIYRSTSNYLELYSVGSDLYYEDQGGHSYKITAVQQ